MFNCEQCLSKCHAECCGIAPIEWEIYIRNIDNVVNKPVTTIPITSTDPIDNQVKNLMLPITDIGSCCFLTPDLKCAIQDDKPNICKCFGNESHPFLKCAWQDKDGNLRTRQVRRNLERKAHNYVKSFLSMDYEK